MEEKTLTGYPSIDKLHLKGVRWNERKPFIPNISISNVIDLINLFGEQNPAVDCVDLKVSHGELKADSVILSRAFAELGVKPGDIIAIAMPNLYQAIACFKAANRIGAVTTFLNEHTPINEIKNYLNQYKSAYIGGIPQLYTHMLHSEAFTNMDLSFLKYAISGGDKLSTYNKKQCNDFLKAHKSPSPVLDGSGNGEGGGALTNTGSYLKRYNPYSIGKPNCGLSVKFVDANGKTVPIGETGRFCFAGKNVMLGYYNDPAGTQKVKYTDADGIEWFHTDTYGHMDRKGWIYFDGRERRFFITFDVNGSPFKVYCDHVQECIMQSGLVHACAVVQRSDNNRGLVPVAYLAAKDDGDFSLLCDAVKHYCSDKLQSCACPTDYYPLEELPMTRAGKVDYRALEKLAAEADR